MRKTKNFKKVIVQPDRHKAITRRNQNFVPATNAHEKPEKPADVIGKNVII